MKNIRAVILVSRVGLSMLWNIFSVVVDFPHCVQSIFFFLLTYLNFKNSDDNDVNRWLTLDGNLIFNTLL